MTTLTPAATWKLEDAKARFSEVVRRAQQEGPQNVTVRGRRAVVVVAAETLDALASGTEPEMSLLDFMRSFAPLGELDVTREPDHGREVDL